MTRGHSLISTFPDAANYLRCRIAALTDTATNSANPAAFADVTGTAAGSTLSLLVEARTYRFEGVLFYTTAATTTGFGLSCNGPTTSLLQYGVWMPRLAASIPYFLQATSTSYDAGGTSADTPAATCEARINGTATFTAAGTFAVRFKSEVNSSAVNVLAGSYLKMIG